jgi:hypothetical protein
MPDRKPTIEMCLGCVREVVSDEWVPGLGCVRYKVCEAYYDPAMTPWGRHGESCPTFSNGKESN